MGILNLARIRSYTPATLHATKDRRSRDDNDALSICIGTVPRALYSELAVPIFRRGVCGSDSMGCGDCANDIIFGFLLYLLY